MIRRPRDRAIRLTFALVGALALSLASPALAQRRGEPSAPEDERDERDERDPRDERDEREPRRGAPGPDNDAPRPAAGTAGTVGAGGIVGAVGGARAGETGPVEVSGYLWPTTDFRYRPDAVRRDRAVFGFGAAAGLIVAAKPLAQWRGIVHLLFRAAAFRAVTGIELVDENAEGAPESVNVAERDFAGFTFEEATVSFEPSELFRIKAGAQRVPFTAQQQSPNTALLFPGRAPPNEVFLSGADIGVLAAGSSEKRVVEGSVGVFGGQSLGLEVPNTVSRGALVSFRGDVHPFGAFPFWEGDPKRGPFRLGFGAGALYRPATRFDRQAGYEQTLTHDVRMSGSIRMSYAGIYLGLEVLRRHYLDDRSSRPRVANGAYVQASYFARVSRTFGVAPIGRLGLTLLDEDIDPRTTGWADLGLSFYPRADEPDPNVLKVTVQYVGERRITENEDAHGAAAALFMRF